MKGLSQSSKITAACLVFILLAMGCGTTYKGPVTDHFDGKKFKNIGEVPHKGFGDMLKWMFSGDKEKWPDWVKSSPGEPPPKRVGVGKVRYTVINHATILIQSDDVNILTDPIWSERASPVTWAGPKRVIAPGLRFEDLPPIDVVLISHNHYDSLDLETLKRLNKDHSPQFFIGLGSKDLLKSVGINNVSELDWWQTRDVKGAKIHFVPAQHFSGRGLFDRFETLWGGFVIQVKYGNLYFAGDTGYGEFVKAIKEKFGHMDISFLPIGAYEPRWFMKAVHVNPKEAVQLHMDLESNYSVGIHFGTFQLTDEAIDAPAKDLKVALDEKLIPSVQFVVPKFGAGVEF